MTQETPAPVVVAVKRIDPDMPLPNYAHPWDAGADLAIAEDCVLAPGERKVVGTGIAIALPKGWAGFVHPRSGLAARSGLTIVNAPGTIDAGYRGEVKVCLLNTDLREPIRLARGDLVAQLVIQRVDTVTFDEADQLSSTERGSGGYGSTGGIADWQREESTTEVKR